jgi:hypothetical protein
MSRWGLRAGVLLVAGGLMFVWAPDVDLGESWGGGGGRAATAPEARSRVDADPRATCAERVIGSTADPSTDITDFRVEYSSVGLVLTAEFRDLRPGMQQGTEFDIRTSRGRDVTVDVRRRVEGGPVGVLIGDAPDAVELARSDACMTAANLDVEGGCVGLMARMDARADLVSVRVPKRCLGNPRWVRAGVSSMRHVSETEIARDVWRPPGGGARDSFGLLGPWVQLS